MKSKIQEPRLTKINNSVSKTLKKTSIALILIVGMIFIFNSCSNEEIVLQATNKNFKFEKIDYHNLLSIYPLESEIKNYIEQKATLKKNLKNFQDIIIDDEVIGYITTANDTTFTFINKTPILENSTVENVLVYKKNDILKFLLIQYIETNNITHQFDGYYYPIEILNYQNNNYSVGKGTSLTKFTVAFEDNPDEISQNNFGSVGGGGSGSNNSQYPSCADITYIACYLPNGERGGADGHLPTCQHQNGIHGTYGCNYLCSGSQTIIDLSGCLENPIGTNTSNPINNTNPFDDNDNSIENMGGGSSSDTNQTENILSGFMYSDGTLSDDLDGHNEDIFSDINYIESVLLELTDEQIDWLNNPVNSNEVSQMANFLTQNQNSQEAMSFVNQAIISQNNSLLNDMFIWMNENENSQESILASTLTLSAYNNSILTSGYSPEVANILNQSANVDFVDPTYFVYFSIQCAIIKVQHPDWSDYRVYWEASKEMVHLGLDVAGLVPVVGEVCDVLNGVIYTIEGDGVNASLSYAGAIPIAGWFATGSKFAYKGALKFVVKADGLIDFGVRNSKKFRETLGLVAGDGKHAHHIIPWELREVSDLVQKAAKSPSAYHIDDALINGIPLNSANHLTGHAIYSEKIKQKLIQINSNSSTPEQAYTNLINFTNQVKQIIQNNPNLNLGQIANLIP